MAQSQKYIEPGGKTVVAGGFWAPNPPDLKRIRQEIEADDKQLRKIINAARFKGDSSFLCFFTDLV